MPESYASAYNQALYMYSSKNKLSKRPKKGTKEYEEVKKIESDIKSGKIKSLVRPKKTKPKQKFEFEFPPAEKPQLEKPLESDVMEWDEFKKEIMGMNAKLARELFKLIST